MVVEFLDRLIPSHLKNNSAGLMRTYIFMSVIAANLLISSCVMIGLFVFFDLPPRSLLAAVLLDGIALIIYIIAYVIFRNTGSYRIAANIVVFFLGFLCFAGISITGGFIESPVSQLVVLIPVNGFLLLGRKDGLRWMFAIFVICGLSYLLTLQDVIFFEQWLEPEQQSLMSVLLLFVSLAMLGLQYYPMGVYY